MISAGSDMLHIVAVIFSASLGCGLVNSASADGNDRDNRDHEVRQRKQINEDILFPKVCTARQLRIRNESSRMAQL